MDDEMLINMIFGTFSRADCGEYICSGFPFGCCFVVVVVVVVNLLMRDSEPASQTFRHGLIG